MVGMRAFDAQPVRKGYAKGGPVRGPGTGTSDDVPDEVQAGTYIMPADSTQAIGEEQLRGLGMGPLMTRATGAAKVPVNLSNGEYKIPPKQVQAIGVETLRQMKDATHTPVAAGGAGMKPELFFANGGWVVEPKVGSRGPLQGASGGGLSNEAVAIAQSRQQPAQQAAQPKKTGMAGLSANPVTNPGAIVRERERVAGFADGDLVTTEEARRRAQQQASNQTAMYVQGAQAATRPPAQAAQVAAPAVSPAPIPQKAPGASQLFMEDRTREMGSQVDAGNYAGAVGTGVRTAVQGLGMYGLEAADKMLTPWVDAGQRMVGWALGTDSPTGEVQTSASTPRAPAAGSPPPIAPTSGVTSNTLTDVQRGDGSVEAPSALPATVPGQPPTQGQVAPGVYQYGRGQYSDNASGMGMGILTGTTAQPSVQNMAAASNLAAQQQPQTPAPGLGTGALVQAPVVRNSTNDWAARKALENAATAASSITNDPARIGSRAAASNPDLQAYNAMRQNDLALQQAQPGADVAALRESSANQRAALQEAGATTRLGVQEAGANARDAGRTKLLGQELGIKQQAQGLQTRAAERLDALQTSYAKEKDPAKQAELARQIRGLMGKETEVSAKDRYLVTGGGTSVVDGQTVKDTPRVFDTSTRQYVDDTGKTAQTPNRAVGSISTVGGKTAVWDGTKWVPR